MAFILKLGARLRAARKAAGFNTSKEFLTKHKVPASTYSQHESGMRAPSDEMLQFYSEIFEVDFDWLKTGDGCPYKISSKAQQKKIMEEMIDLKQFKHKVSTFNQPLLTKILMELLKLNQLNFSEKKIKAISSKTISIYNEMINGDVPEKLQNKMLKKLLADLSF